MAIHTDYPGLKVEIVVNGQPLPEHDPETNTADSNVVTKYVEAESGAEFSVNSASMRHFQPVTMSVLTVHWMGGRFAVRMYVGQSS
jgi:hypothetical protein